MDEDLIIAVSFKFYSSSGKLITINRFQLNRTSTSSPIFKVDAWIK